MLRARSRLRASTGLAVWSLNLELATATGGLDPRVTFSRTSQATLVDATGRVTYAPNNLLTNSESFEASAWNKSGATVTANSTAAPDGTTTADALVEDATTGLHLTQQSFTFVSGVPYTVSVYVKAGTRTWVQMLLPSAAFTASQGGFFDLTGAGALGTTNGTPTARTITALANGWYRISVTATATTSASGNVAIVAASANGTTSYAGSNGSTAVLLWGAQLEAVTYQTTPGTYNSTTPKNLLGFTQEFNNAFWTNSVTGTGSAPVITANVGIAPDGTETADQVVFNSGAGTTSTDRSLISSSNVSVIASTTYTHSIFVKGAAGTKLVMRGVGASSYASITLTGEWDRVTGSEAAASSSGSFEIGIRQGVTGTINSTATVLLWGAQLSNSASLDPYVYNPAAAPTSAAYYGPRFDYNPATLAPRGLLIEEQRTNRTLNSEDFTAATWVATVVGTSTRVNDGAPLGFTRGLITATSATGGIRQVHSGLASGQVYALSFYIQSTATSVQIVFENGTAQFGSGHNVTINPSNGTAGVLTGFTSVSIQPFGPGYVYTLITAPAGGALSANIEWRITNSGNSIWLGRPQFEAGAFATSYIPTAASQVTRNADVATMVGANFASWYNQSEGTFVATGSSFGGAVSGLYEASASGAAAQSISVRLGQRFSFAQNLNRFDFSYTTGNTINHAFAYSASNYGAAVGGTNLTVNANGQPTSVPAGANQLALGYLGSSAFMLNGHIRSIRYYPVRLSNTQLQALTA